MSAIPWLILPTYNEAENIELLASRAAEVLAEASPDGFRVLIVDDGSPDGTGQLADKLASAHEQIEVLHRTTRAGLGPAYLAGFKHALDGGAGFVMEMDSDFSHDPRDLARLLKAVRDDGADLALGSRYVSGGGIEDWSLQRHGLNRVAGRTNAEARDAAKQAKDTAARLAARFFASNLYDHQLLTHLRNTGRNRQALLTSCQPTRRRRPARPARSWQSGSARGRRARRGPGSASGRGDGTAATC